MNTIQFLTDPSFRRAGRGCIALCEPLVVHDTMDGGSREWIVPVGYVSDGGTIPPWAWAIVGHPYSGSALRPFLWHDLMCSDRSHGLSARNVHDRLHRALLCEGDARARANLIYWAVVWRGPRWAAAPATP